MAASTRIKVMISSRCKDTFPVADKNGLKLTDLRRKLRDQFEGLRVFGEQLHDVWIHETAAENATLNSWDECLKQARDCDIFIVLFNGNAGSTGGDGTGTVGICLAEYNTAYSQAPGKVFIVNIFEKGDRKGPSGPIDKEFQVLIDREGNLGKMISDPGTLQDEIARTIVRATARMAQLGTREANRGRGYLGPALAWNRQNYTQRQTSMIAAMRVALAPPRGSGGQPNVCTAKIGNTPISFRLGAVPDSMSIAAARELVGQPHLTDHVSPEWLNKVDGGPVHVIACHKGVTATQAQRMLGFPNATVVNAPFGIYVLDKVQAIQLVLIADCSDATETRYGVQRFLAWLQQAEQAEALVSYAKKRKELVTLLAKDA
jgi:hypothetical protein